MIGINRNVKEYLQYLRVNFPVIAIVGPRQARKTTLAKQMLPAWKYFNLERPADYELIANDPDFFFKRHHQHIIIDEAQLMPALFNVSRGVIDERRQEVGRFVL